MDSHLTLNGLPEKLRLDGWWLAENAGTTETAQSKRKRGLMAEQKPTPTALLLALLLIFLSDLLFWHHAAGLSLALFSSALSLSMMLSQSRRFSTRNWALAGGFTLMMNLPVLDYLQPLSLLFSALGIALLAIWLAMGRLVGWAQGLAVFFYVSFLGPLRIFVDLWQGVDGIRSDKSIAKRLFSFVLPLSFGLAFFWLLTIANPFLDDIAQALGSTEFLSPDAVARAVFWGFVAVFVWPYINLHLFRASAPKALTLRIGSPLAGGGWVVNAGSVRSSLFLFNGIFAVQTGSDLLFLSGGVALPEGMSYASYAHRGAYPLMATALLAGAFAIGTRKLIVEDRLLRGLVYLWLLQNLFLVLTAAFRLSLYVETYALTYLRVAAFIWMFLVFFGLLLVFRQISGNKGNIWLLTQNCLALLAALYISCFVNFAQLIASHNITHPTADTRLDDYYLCRLGAQALPVILTQQAKTNTPICTPHSLPVFHPIEGWRDWGFRNWRIQRYLVENFQYEAGYEHSYSDRR